ncbi:hypothetical protein CTAYLR_006276 [Chrysophaeum taylorii]|uniref:Uncharacterized protein n=1 Tax=Chrysophaeum taylorii TaxID=2483200 RepID=A0AAD7UKC6_9STRA|nr:hypothetical protein CTAYLR_006276 [Chrysophaeum taylorii]
MGTTEVGSDEWDVIEDVERTNELKYTIYVLRTEAENLRKDKEQLERQLEDESEQCLALQTTVEELQCESRTFAASVRDLEQENVDVRAELERAGELAAQELAAKTADLERTLEAVSKRAAELAAAQDEVAALEAELSASRDGRAAKDAELEEKKDQLGAATRALAAKDAELAGKEEQLGAATRALAAKDSELAAKDSELAGKEEQLGAATRALAAKDSELATKQQQLDATTRALATKSEMDAARKDAEIAEVRAEAATARDALGEKVAEAAKAKEEVAAVREAARMQLESLVMEKKALAAELAAIRQEHSADKDALINQSRELSERADVELAAAREESRALATEVEAKREVARDLSRHLRTKYEDLAACRRCLDALVSSTGVASLARLLGGPDVRVDIEVARAIRVLGDGAFVADIVPHLVRLAEGDMGLDDVLGAIATLAKNPGNKVVLREAGVIPRLGELVALPAALEAIENLARGNPENKDAMVDVVPDVVAQLPSDRACRALAALAEDNTTNQDAIAREGAIPKLVGLLGDGGGRVAVETLFCLVKSNAVNQVLVSTAGAIPALVHLLETGDDLAARAAAAETLAELAAANANNQVAMVDSDAIVHLIAFLRDARDDEFFLKGALLALLFVARGTEEHCHMIATAGALPPLRAINPTDIHLAAIREDLIALLDY